MYGEIVPPHWCYADHMALSGEQLKWRIKAATALHELHAKDLPDLLEKFGAERHLAAGLMDGRIEPRRAKLDQLAAFFKLPVQFFEDEKWEPADTYTMPMPDASEGLRRQREGLLKLEDISARLERTEALVAANQKGLEVLELRLVKGLVAAENALRKLDEVLALIRQPPSQGPRREAGGR